MRFPRFMRRHNQPRKPWDDDVDILFLDVDGVLNSRRTRETGDHLPADEPVENLRRIVDATQRCTIVLSSTWRLDAQQREALAAVLAMSGLSFSSVTPDLEAAHTGDRVDEILQWLREHPGPTGVTRAWIALDDLDLLMMNPKLPSTHFVRTSDSIGLTRENADLAIRLLQEQRAAFSACFSDTKAVAVLPGAKEGTA